MRFISAHTHSLEDTPTQTRARETPTANQLNNICIYLCICHVLLLLLLFIVLSCYHTTCSLVGSSEIAFAIHMYMYVCINFSLWLLHQTHAASFYRYYACRLCESRDRTDNNKIFSQCDRPRTVACSVTSVFIFWYFCKQLTLSNMLLRCGQDVKNCL